jgi:hypothetical protein
MYYRGNEPRSFGSKTRLSVGVRANRECPLGVVHRYLDPNNEQRIALGIRQKQEIQLEGFYNDWSRERIEQELRVSHSRREQYWLRHIVQLDCWPTLFVCGACHIEPFCLLAKTAGLFVDLVEADWAPA